MNYLRRRLSDSSFVANLPNGYMMDLQRPSSPSSSPVSPAAERRQQQPATAPSAPAAPASSTSAGFLSSLSSVVKSAQAAQTFSAAAHAQSAPPAAAAPPAPPAQLVPRKPKILLIIDDPHTDWAKYFRGKKLNGEYEIRLEQVEHTCLDVPREQVEPVRRYVAE
ncbi:hypothetical protein AAFF_G00171370 [Aldrovandia affinis]|uniref:Synapsin pre-ATP-grasp domain-containing protein n=1 Tax=Aldrovandia affinis TaxID=143900 RepID=A0AAD7WVI7_9TELE|nr:hypothetical protein AAFF_G00171370 [Aldrovandia affinis]